MIHSASQGALEIYVVRRNVESAGDMTYGMVIQSDMRMHLSTVRPNFDSEWCKHYHLLYAKYLPLMQSKNEQMDRAEQSEQRTQR